MSRKFSHWARLAPAAVAAAAIAMSGNGNEGLSTDGEPRVSVVQASEIQKLLTTDAAAAQTQTGTAAETDTSAEKEEDGTDAAETASKLKTDSDTEESSDGETASAVSLVSSQKESSAATTSAQKKTIVKGSHTRPTTSTTASTAQAQGTTYTPVTEIPSGGYQDGTYSGSGTGFGGTVSVSVTVSGGKIASISITSAAGETAEYLSRAKGVVSSILSSQSPNVDAVSGATYSSNGIIQAVQNALSKAANNGADSGDESSDSEPAMTEEELEEALAILSGAYSTPTDGYADGTYTGSAMGYGGTVTVTVVISGGEITSITAENKDTEQFWKKAWETLQPEILLKQTTDGVDTVSGATYSSSGIINAVKQALTKAAEGGEDEEVLPEEPTPTPEPTVTPEPTATPEPTVTPEPTAMPEPTAAPETTPAAEPTTEPETTPAAEPTTVPDTETEVTPAPESGDVTPTPEPTAAPTEAPAGLYRDGTYTGSAYGFDEDVPVTVTVTISGGAITGLSQTNNDWADYFDDAWETISSAIFANQSTDGVDTVSGATWSSHGILDAAAAALAQAKQ